MEEIKQGYKQTDIGVIPEDWNLKFIFEIGDLRGRVGWKGYTVNDLRKSGAYAIGAKHIDNNYKLDLSEPTYLSNEKYIESPEIMVQKNDLLVVQRGTIGKLVLIENEIGEATINPSMVILRLKKTLPQYLYYYLISSSGQKQILNDVSSTGVPMITQKQVENFTVPIPILAEQTAIATALSDTDALIAALDKKIAKKQQIKQGAMQQLLTGKKRLPGFSGEWVENEFKEFCWFQEGPGLRNWQFTSSGIKVINVTNLEKGVLNLSNTNRYISLAEFHSMYLHFEIEENDIVVASSGNSYGKSAIVRKRDLPLLMNTSVIRFKPKKGLDYKFLWVFLNSDGFKKQIDLLITGGAQPNFGPAHLNKLNIFMPNDVTEQNQIAQILTDMDNEIAQLKKEQDKYKEMKAGMMQVLLTGKVRLV